MSIYIARVPRTTHRIILFFKSSKQPWINTNYSIRSTQRKPICSNASTGTVEASLISVFTRRPFCLQTPELQELSSKLTPKVVETVLKSFTDWRLAQVFFNWVSSQEDFSHNCYTYNAMAAILSNARQNAPLRELTEKVLNSRCFWTAGALGYFLRCLGSQGLVEEANYLFDQVRMYGLCDLNCYSYNCLLEVIAVGGDVNLLNLRLNEMRNLGLPIEKHALTPALRCYCNARKFDKASMIFNELNDKGWVDQYILAIFVLSFSKCGEVDTAFELIEWAERNLKISLNEKTLCVLIHGFVGENRVDKALQLYDKMRNIGYMPDVSVFDVLIRGLCKNKEIGKALMLYMQMKELRISPDVQIISLLVLYIPEEREAIQLLEDSWMDFNVEKKMLLYKSVLIGLVNGGHVDKAYYLLKETMESGTFSFERETHGTTCFQKIIDGLCNANKLDLALDLFHFMAQRGCKRSVLLFNNLINCLSNADRLRECFDLLNEMKQTEFQPTHFTFNCILGCLCRREDVEGVLTLLGDMRLCGHEPWIKHYTLLVKKLCEKQKAVEAHDFLADMTKIGFLPDMIAYSATIDGFLSINELDQAQKLFREICERGYCPDIVAYNTIIKGFCKAARIAEAEEILNEILSKGLVPSVITYNLLIDGWCKYGDINHAFLWFSKMVEEEKEPNVITYTTLVDGLCNAGKPDEALEIWMKMEHKNCEPSRISYMALISGLCKCRKPDVALIYLQKMEEKEMLPDTYIYKALIDAFASDSNTDMARELSEKMAKLVS